MNERNYNSISPSAKALLLMKACTPIPYAKEAALLAGEDQSLIKPDQKDASFWARVAHFEVRYQSISRLLAVVEAGNILELSSGFSFRRLDMVQRLPIHYIDTDLPELIAEKHTFIDALYQSKERVGTLEVLPLNALDEHQFQEVVQHFPEGPLTIVNEGLLMYLGVAEKQQLCRTIHAILKARGGSWITADIYFKSPQGATVVKADDKLQQFFERHHIEENKFEHRAAAEAFFKENGFEIEREAAPDYARATSLKPLLEALSEDQKRNMPATGHSHTTWMLKVAE